MRDFIWNGEMDMGWEDLKSYLVKKAEEFVRKALSSADQSCNDSVKNLVNEKSMQRFSAVIAALSEDMEDVIYYTHEDMEEKGVNRLKMEYWILLGSATEVALQVFLSIYIEEYEEKNWQQWEDFSTSEVKEAIFSTIDKLVEDGKIKREYGRSIKNVVKEEIKNHMNIHSVEKVMLDEIIHFYDKNKILDQEDIKELRYIQRNRNCIHAYIEREIGNWSSLQYSIRFFCYLLELFIFRMPGE